MLAYRSKLPVHFAHATGKRRGALALRRRLAEEFGERHGLLAAVDKHHNLVPQTDIRQDSIVREAIERVAETTGFRDPERMRRAFIRAFGQPPQALRRAARAG